MSSATETGRDLEGLKLDLTSRIGVMLIKPDAVRHGVEPQILQHLQDTIHGENSGRLQGAFRILSIDESGIPLIYPSLPKDLYPTVAVYLSSGPSTLAAFVGDGTSSLERRMCDLKGPRMLDWSDEELRGIGKDIRRGIRYLLPVSGTEESYASIIENIRRRRIDPTVTRFTDDQYSLACQNLVHSPEGADELIALLDLVQGVPLDVVVGPELAAMVMDYRRLRGE